MRAIVPIGGLAVVIIVGAVGYQLGGRRAKHPATSDPRGASAAESTRTEDVDGLRSQVAELERKLGVLTAHVATQNANGAGPDEAHAPATREPVSHEQQVERDRVAWENHMVAVEAAFTAEPRDPAWADSKANLLRERSANDKVIRSAVKQIECRSTTCRVEMVDDQKGEFTRKLPDFLTGVSNVFSMGQARTVDNPDGTKTLNVYLSTAPASAYEVPDSPGS